MLNVNEIVGLIKDGGSILSKELELIKSRYDVKSMPSLSMEYGVYQINIDGEYHICRVF